MCHINLFLKLFLLLILIVNIETTSESYGQRFYSLAKAYRNSTPSSSLPKIHLIRVPKASSSSLSAIARRMVGCSPAGPCCKWPGDPPGSCPSKELFACQTQGKVIGCTHHHPNYPSLLDKSIVSISIMREPLSRSVSAFFYPGIHHNSQCKGNHTYCFLEYTRSEKWKNIAVKMMTGLFAYSPEKVCEHAKDCPHSLELAILNLDELDFMGIAEMWELSLFLLHYKHKSIPPVLEEFLLSNQSSAASGRRKLQPSNNEIVPDDSILTLNEWQRLLLMDRENHEVDYIEFKKTAMTKFASQLQEQNALDIKLYEKAVVNMCNELHALNLWTSEAGPLIQEYWSKKSPLKTVKC